MHPEFSDVRPGERMEMDVDKGSRGGFEKKSQFETAIPSTIGERSRFIPRDSVASWDLEVPRGYLRTKKFVKIRREHVRIALKTDTIDGRV